ncbi:Dbl homology domain-containing protein [Chlamydoabsidia padenii]|nr:Dbl homology domain-containing protein [Chlamydoabsidia padenii]
MANDIEGRFSCLGLSDNNRPDSMIQIGDMEEKELRRISLPTDPYRRSKFASWVQYNLPTPPSSRNNSRGSRSSSGRSSMSELTSSPTISPTISPTSCHAPPLPPIAPVPTTSVSSSSTTTTTTMSPPRSTSLIFKQQDQERHAPLRSMSEPNQQKKKKRFLPLVSRLRLSTSDKLGKKQQQQQQDQQRPSINPPEPPPQLLMSALHCNDQDKKQKSLSQNDLDQQPFERSSTPASLSWFDSQQESVLDLSLMGNKNRIRRRSSCPPRPLDPTTPEESVMMRSFASPALMSPASPYLAPPEEDVYDKEQRCLLSFSAMAPRSRPLRRRTSGKREKKAFRAWHDSLVDSLKKGQGDEGTLPPPVTLSNEKRERNALTRKFILREFYLTEVTFWNQLYYTKVMFGDPLQLSLDRNSAFTRTSDLDIFSNLPDLMQCSSQLIRSMAPYLDHPPCVSQEETRQHTTNLPLQMNDDARLLPSPNNQLLLGKEICAMANQFVVFLRCAVDYKLNRKKLDQRSQHNKGFAMYQEKLALRKETNQFYVHDYLIIPIQRVARYGLLLADLQKHTEVSHPDYHHIRRARMILTSLAIAMNKAQQ